MIIIKNINKNINKRLEHARPLREGRRIYTSHFLYILGSGFLSQPMAAFIIRRPSLSGRACWSLAGIVL